MTKHVLAAVVALGLAAGAVMGQSAQLIRVNVPFDFVAGKKSFPAGEYMVRSSLSPGTLVIQPADYSSSLVLLAHQTIARTEPETAKLTFHKYGDRYFLSQVFSPGTGIGQELPKTRLELEQIAASKAPASVTVLARR